jgi:hypothetical protein
MTEEEAAAAAEAPAEEAAPPAEEEAAPVENDANAEWSVAEAAKTEYATGEGEDVTIEVKLNKGDILAPPKVTWVKGKWNQLTKGDRYDIESSGDHMTHKCTFLKPKMNEAGAYCCKIKDKKKETVLQFQVKITPAKKAAGVKPGKGSGAKPAGDNQADMDFRAQLRKTKKVKKVVEDENIWVKLRDANTRDYDEIAFEHNISDMRAMLRRLASIKKREGKRIPTFAKALPPHKHCKVGEKIVMVCETKDKATKVKWHLNGKQLDEGSKVKIEEDGFKRICTIDPASLVHDGTISVNIGDDVTYCEVFVEEHKLGIEQQFEDYTGLEDDEVVLECEVSSDSGKFKIMKNGQELTRSGTVKVKRDGKKIKIIINPASKEDSGYYSIETNNGDVSYADVLIEERPAEITRAFSDLKVNCKDRAEFVCEVSSDDVKGKWYKDGVEIDPEKDDRIKVVSIGKMRKLIIENVCNADQGEYGFTAEGHPACKISAALDTCYATVQKKKEAPKIYLDRSEDKSITVKAGNNLKLDVPLTGSDHKITWRRGPANEEDAEVIPMDGKRIWCTDGSDKERTSFNLNKAEFDDQGPYSVQIEFKDKDENIHKIWNEYMIMVIDVPSPPQKPEIGEVGSDTCELNWLPPLDDGGCPFRGYIIERKKVKSSRWIRLNGALCTFHNFQAKRMVEGTSYQVRVIAVNEVGQSQPSELSREFIPMAPTAGVSLFKTGKRTDESIELRWLEPEEIGAGGLDKYILEMKKIPSDNEDWGEAPCGVIDRTMSSIDITKLQTGASYYFRICTENIAGRSEWREIGPIICAESVEAAKINLPRCFQNKKRIKIIVGEPLKFIIPFCGKPKPRVSWTKDGEELKKGDDGRPRFHVRNIADSTTLFCRATDRWDTGTYTIAVEVGTQKVDASLDVAIIDVASKPVKVQIADVVGTSAQLKWQPPKDDGNCDILGYQVEKRDARSDEWFVCVERVRNPNVQINDLVLGNSYYFRVKCINEVGLGDEAVTKDCAVIVKDKMVYKKPVLPPLDFSLKPSFTKKLNDRKIMAGYNGVLTASLQGHPKPKLRWYKGKIEIIDNPKYKTTFSQGIVQLEIRRARPGDAGVYRLVAENSMGTDECEASVVVKELKD